MHLFLILREALQHPPLWIRHYPQYIHGYFTLVGLCVYHVAYSCAHDRGPHQRLFRQLGNRSGNRWQAVIHHHTSIIVIQISVESISQHLTHIILGYWSLITMNTNKDNFQVTHKKFNNILIFFWKKKKNCIKSCYLCYHNRHYYVTINRFSKINFVKEYIRTIMFEGV